jgi:hypothetical protein
MPPPNAHWPALLALADTAATRPRTSPSIRAPRAHQHAAGSRKDGTAQKEPPGGTCGAEPATTPSAGAGREFPGCGGDRPRL